MYLSLIINIFLVIAFIVDRLFRLSSLKEYDAARNEIIKSKDTQIDTIKQQLEYERSNNDVVITEMHKKRYESLKLILQEKEETLLLLQKDLENANKEADLKENFRRLLMFELNGLQESKKKLETETDFIKFNHHFNSKAAAMYNSNK